MLGPFALYLVQATLLLLGVLVYFGIAEKLNIIDKPNKRSSHINPTIKGGGIIFVLAVLFFAFSESFDQPYFLVGFLIISLVSFLDDIREMPKRWRLGIHLLASLLLVLEVSHGEVGWWQWVVFSIIAISMINIYNFMDGVNAMTSFYSLVILGALFYLQQKGSLLIPKELIVLPIIAIVIFSVFNVRKRARCFAGDVGSVSLAFLITYLIGLLCWQQQDFTYIWLLGLYGVDGILTIIQRLLLGENILKGHRLHLYQLMANEGGISHLKVSALYAILQIVLNVLIIGYIVPGEFNPLLIHFLLALIGVSIYILVKIGFIKRAQESR